MSLKKNVQIREATVRSHCSHDQIWFYPRGAEPRESWRAPLKHSKSNGVTCDSSTLRRLLTELPLEYSQGHGDTLS